MKFTTSKLLLFFLAGLFSLTLSAQRTYFEGAIIKKNGDTLRGYLDYNGLGGALKIIKFKPTENAPFESFKPSQINGFVLKKLNNIYKSAFVKINSEKYDFEDGRTYESIKAGLNDVRWREDTLFLLTLVKGKINLYEYYDDFGESHFIYQKGDNGKYETLVNLQFKIRENDILKIVKSEDYKPQLKNLLLDCPSVDVNYKRMPYNAPTIADLIKAYNKCSQNLSYIKPIDKYSKKLYGGIGIAIPRGTLIDAFDSKFTFKGKVSPTVCIGLELRPVAKKLKLFDAFGLDLSATTMQFNDSIQYVFLGRNDKYKGDFINLNIAPYLRFSYYLMDSPQKSMAAYLKLAPVFTILAKNDLETPNDYFSAKRTSFSVMGNIGINYNRFFIEGRYQTLGWNLIKDDNIFLNQTHISLLAGYYF